MNTINLNVNLFVVLILSVVVLLSGTATQAVTIDTVPVGNPGNTPDTEVMTDGTTGYGSVSYNYRIGKTEVTNAQYTEFLNAVAASDPYRLYNDSMSSNTIGGITRSGLSGSYTYAVKENSVGNGPGGADGNDYTYGDKPVNYVSWYDSFRFANWLHNDQGSGDSETGAYTLLGGTPTPSNGNSITRNSNATWFLPSEDEWYKAAYHMNNGVTGNYWDYPTSTNTTPNNNLPSSDTGNSANTKNRVYTSGDPNYPMMDAGAYTLSDSPYGTFDQGGNVWEWNETIVYSSSCGLRGDACGNSSNALSSSSRRLLNPTKEYSFLGFRVARIPEPGDFDFDGDIDGTDLLMWQRGEVSNPPSFEDLALWQANFGNSSLLATANIPEPSTLLLGAMAAMGLLMRRRSLR